MLLTLLATLPALFPGPAVAAQDLPGPSALVRTEDRAGRIDRDHRLSFGGRTVERVREALRGDPNPLVRPGILMALGCSGELGDVAVLESFTEAEALIDRRAATLALGELGGTGRGPLQRLLEGEVAGLAECFVLAWIHSDPAHTAAAMEAWIMDLAHPLHDAALLFRGYAEGGGLPTASPAVELWLDLRWDAARRFGMVDGRRWKDLLVAELLGSDEFLDRVVLGAAARRDEASVRDHLFEILRDGDRPSALPAAVIAMPEQLGAAVEGGVWVPANLDEWKLLLREIEDRRIEKRARALLEEAMKIEELQSMAGIQLLRAGGEMPKAWLSYELHSAPLARRALALEASGDRQDLERVDDLVRYLDPGQPVELQAAALVSLVRLRNPTAIDSLRLVLAGGKTVERREILLSLARQFHDGRLANIVADVLELDDLDPEVRFRLEVAQGVHGYLSDRTHLREWLLEGHRHPMRRDVVRALAVGGDLADIQVLRELFPVEDDLEVNIELAVALLAQRDQAAIAILQTALWHGNWNRGVLAGGLLAHAVSIHGLIEELDSPPRGTGTDDLRRVGFAIGEFGGLSAVGTLARRRQENDPALQGALLGALSTHTQ